MKRNVLCIVLTVIVLLCTGCGKGKAGLSGSYKGESGLSDEYVLTFSSDGTCSMDETVYSSWLEGGSESRSYTGIWRENDSGDNYEVILNNWSGTLYAELLENGDLLVTSDESWWDNMTAVKVE